MEVDNPKVDELVLNHEEEVCVEVQVPLVTEEGEIKESPIVKKKRSKITLTNAIERHTLEIIQGFQSFDSRLSYLGCKFEELCFKLDELFRKFTETDKLDHVHGKVVEIENLLREVRQS